MAERAYGRRLLQTGTLDLDSGELHHHDGSITRLTHLERKLLRYLDAREGQIVSAEELHAEVWGHASRVVSRAVDNTASRLRKKIEPTEGAPIHLQRIPNEGFVFHLLPTLSSVPLLPPIEPFFGRTEELSALGALLETARLIEILGPGGIGKTRLVQEAARRLLGRTIWIDLSAVTDHAGLHAATAEALGVSGPLGVLLSSMVDTTLILDNVEQIVEVVAEALRQWQGPRWVLTSRRAVRLRGIRTLRLGPLDKHSARAMLQDRADSRRHGWGTRKRDAASLAALTDLLEGWPLAIELAAGRAALLPPAAMLQQLCRAPAPEDTSRPLRQSSLTRTLEWSWSLLAPVEQRALARLSVFQRSFTVEAALAVLSEPSLEILERLLDHSVLAPYTSQGDTPRLRMLDTIARFVAASTDAGERRVAAQCAAAHLVQAYGEDTLPLLSEQSPDGDEFRIQVREDRDNLLAAMRFLLDSGDTEGGMWLARVLTEDLSLQQDHTYLAELAEDALSRRSPGVEATQDLAVQLLQGYAWSVTGRLDEGYTRLCDVAAAAEAKGNREFAASAHYARLVVLMRGWQESPLVAAAEAVRRVCGVDPAVWLHAARADCMQGSWECRYAHLEPQGRARLETLLAAPQLRQYVTLKIYVLLGLGTAALTRDQPHEAERLVRQAERLLQETGQQWPFSVLLLGRALLGQGRPADARVVLETAVAQAVRLQHHCMPEARLLLSRACHALGEGALAADLLSQTGDDLLLHPYDKTRIQWLLERARQASSPALAAELRAQAGALIPAGAPVPHNITALMPRDEEA